MPCKVLDRCGDVKDDVTARRQDDIHSPLPCRMPFTQYGTNLYALNALGEAWLSQTVTLATFRGPPMVLVDTVISDTDPNTLALIDFAAFWNAPLVGFDRSVTVPSWALSVLESAGLAAAKFFTASHILPFALPIGNVATAHPLCGPWIASEVGGPATTIDAWEALGASSLIRTTQNHPYGCGMQAVSHFTATTNAPPLYGIGLALDTIETLTRMQKKWSGDSVTTVAQYQALAVAAAIRPGLARLCNPALLPELVIAEPV